MKKIWFFLIGVLLIVGCTVNESSDSSEMTEVVENDIKEKISVEELEPVVDFSEKIGFNLINETLMGEWAGDDAKSWAFNFMEAEGFTIARVPFDGKRLFLNGDYEEFDDTTLEEIDEIIEEARKCHIHVILDLHMLFDFGIIGDMTEGSEKTQSEKLEIWVRIFQMMAKRYKDISNQELSFNLINEPFELDDETYYNSIKAVMKGIREVDPDRMIFLDINNYSGTMIEELVSLKDMYIVISPHFYEPFEITHYFANWVEGSEFFPEPVYPYVQVNQFLYGSYHPEFKDTFNISGQFSKGTQINFTIKQVSSLCDVFIRADGEIIWHQKFEANNNPSEWENIIYNEEWDIYQNILNETYSMSLPNAAQNIEILIGEGDWLSFTKVEINDLTWESPVSIIANGSDWGLLRKDVYINHQGTIDVEQTDSIVNKQYLYDYYMKELIEFRERTGYQIFCGEFGVYNTVPHDVTLRIIADHVELMKENNIGFTLWNLRGTFGIIDSERVDVEYEKRYEHLIDVKMLEILKK